MEAFLFKNVDIFIPLGSSKKQVCISGPKEHQKSCWAGTCQLLAGFYPSSLDIKSDACCLLFLGCLLSREYYIFLPIRAPDSEADLFLLVNLPLPLARFAEHTKKKKKWHHMPINLEWRLAASETVKLACCTLADFWIVGKQRSTITAQAPRPQLLTRQEWHG